MRQLVHDLRWEDHPPAMFEVMNKAADKLELLEKAAQYALTVALADGYSEESKIVQTLRKALK